MPDERTDQAREAADYGLAVGAVAAGLAVYQSTGSKTAVLTAISRSRVLVPVVAVPAPDGAQSTTQMATVLLTGRDGRKALLAFSSLEALTRWRPDARPVPRPTASAARAAVNEGAAALLLDVAGPVRLALDGEDLHNLAAGLVLVDVGTGHAWAAAGTASDWYPRR